MEVPSSKETFAPSSLAPGGSLGRPLGVAGGGEGGDGNGTTTGGGISGKGYTNGGGWGKKPTKGGGILWKVIEK